MLSVKPSAKTWKEPGYYNSCLSGVIWVVQLIIFHASVCLEKAELGSTLERIEQYCERFLRQTPRLLWARFSAGACCCSRSPRRLSGRTKHNGIPTRRA